MNPYQILEIPNNSTIETAKKQFRILSKKYHPDLGGSSEKFIQIKQAFELIKNGYKYQKPLYNPFENIYREPKKVEAYFKFVSKEINKKGAVKVQFKFKNVMEVNCYNLITGYEIGFGGDFKRGKEQTVNIHINKKDLKKLNYDLTFEFISVDYKFGTKNIKIPKPLTWYEKIIKKISEWI